MSTKPGTTFESPWWYRQVPRDFMSSPDVYIMSAEECGSFFFLLQHAWLSGDDCTLPNDPARLAKLARVDTVADIVLKKFQLDEQGRLFNPRLSAEWNEALKRSKDGKKNASKRWDSSMPRHSRRNATALASQCQANATNTNTNTHTNKEARTMQTHASVSEADASFSGLTSEPANRLGARLAQILGRNNLKPATVAAWTQQAESLLQDHDEKTILAVMQWALVDVKDGFWRGRIFAMKNFVRGFNAMLTQYKRGDQKPATATDTLAERAASLKTGHDFSAMAKGDL